jgi:hypothetical protein
MVGRGSPMGGPWVVPWVVQSPMGRSVGDHVCWPFRDRGELAVVARAFLLEGLGRDERVAYVGQGHSRDLRYDLVGVPGLQRCLDRGQLRVADIATMPASDPLTDPVDELIDLAAMTQDALDAGYTGLRMMANGPCGWSTRGGGTGSSGMSICSTGSAWTMPSPACAP